MSRACLVDEHPVGDAVLVDAGGSAEAGRACADDDDADLRSIRPHGY